MKHNFHTHTTRCKHAVGTDEDYVKAALDGGFDVLGFADHAPWAFETPYVSHCRMLPTQWEDYKQSVLALKEKYRGQIDIHLGLECEHYDKYFDQLLRLRDDGCEYFILGCHFLYSEENNPYVGEINHLDDTLLRYAEETVKGIRTGLYAYVAHPDLYMMHREEFTHHPRGYPNADFWQYIRKWDNDIIIGVDAHDPAQLRNELVWDTAIKRLDTLGHRLVNHIL